jgi:hypothetical protein
LRAEIDLPHHTTAFSKQDELYLHMSKIRSVSELIDVLDNSSAWRKKELSILHGNVQKSSALQKVTNIRSGIRPAKIGRLL